MNKDPEQNESHQKVEETPLSRVVRRGAFKEMTFKPRPKLKRRAAMWRPGGRAFWTEGAPSGEAKVLIWDKLRQKRKKGQACWRVGVVR